MATITQLLTNARRALSIMNVRGAIALVRAYGVTDDDDGDSSDVVAAMRQGAHGGVVVEGASGGEPVPVSGTVTVDTTTLETTLAAIQTLATTPTIPAQITPSDDTDTSTLTAKGLLVEVAGDLAIRGTGAPSTTVTITVVAGQYVPIQCSRVMAATTATVVGLA